MIPPGLRLRQMFRAALQRSPMKPKEAAVGDPLPRWPSGLFGVEDKAGGFFGLTVLSGLDKTGKSLAALRSAIETATRGDAYVIYIDYELDRGTFGDRLCDAFRVDSLAELPAWLPDRMRPLDGGQAGLEQMVDYLPDQIPRDAERLVLVIDSVNRMARYSSKDGANSWNALDRCIYWADNLKRLTHGHIGVLLVSEQNRQGQTLGHSARFAADVILEIRRTKNPGIVTMDLTCRSAPSGNLGRYERLPRSVEFIPEGSQHHDAEPDRDGVPIVDVGPAQSGLWEGDL